MDKRLNIALICFDNPFLPPQEGGKRGMRTRIESLLLHDRYDLDIYLMNKRAEGLAGSFGNIGEKAHAIYQYPMRSGAVVLKGPYPICVNKRYVTACVDELKNKRYDVAIYEGEQVAKYRYMDAVDADYHILYMHDIESNYRAEISKSQKGLLRLANIMESKRFSRIERCVDQHFDRVWFVSKEECDLFSKRFLNPAKGIYIPFPALQIADEPVRGNKLPHMLYVGDLNILHNYLSVEWFARNVFPIVRTKCMNAELMVIGRISAENAKTLMDLGIKVCGYVEDLDAAYKEAACIVAPILFGAGVKVKTIDALARGQIVITTTKGVEGTELKNGKHLIVEDDAADLAEKCCEILQRRDQFAHLAEDGLAYVKHIHTISHQAEIIDREIILLLDKEMVKK